MSFICNALSESSKIQIPASPLAAPAPSTREWISMSQCKRDLIHLIKVTSMRKASKKIDGFFLIYFEMNAFLLLGLSHFNDFGKLNSATKVNGVGFY